MSPARSPDRFRALACLALVAAFIAAPGAAVGTSADGSSVVKAAFLYNFAKYTEWPALLSDAPIVACVVGDDGIAFALAGTVRGQNISGHAIDVRRGQSSATWTACHLLFIADTETKRFARELGGIRTLPVLTVSDGRSFALEGGIIELYVEGGLMHFAINRDAADHAGLRISSRLLVLSKVRNGDGQ
jgi:hypothetical protein